MKTKSKEIDFRRECRDGGDDHVDVSSGSNDGAASDGHRGSDGQCDGPVTGIRGRRPA